MPEDPKQRSAVMKSVRSHGTGPERIVRQLVRALGVKAVYNRKSLPGAPDIVIAAQRKVIFVHGCFWHGHSCKRGARVPKNNHQYWLEKVSRNKLRDRRHRTDLRKLGWLSLVIWECQLRQMDRVAVRVRKFLLADSARPYAS